MYRFLFVFAVLALFSCNKEVIEISQEPSTTSQWYLIEQYTDPGDGSGSPVAIFSDRRLELMDDGRVSSNADLCQMGTDSEGVEFTYLLDQDFINVNSCKSTDPTNTFQVSVEILGDSLFLRYPCREACYQLYIKDQ